MFRDNEAILRGYGQLRKRSDELERRITRVPDEVPVSVTSRCAGEAEPQSGFAAPTAERS